MRKEKKKSKQTKKPHWPILGFIKEKMNSWYLMHPLFFKSFLSFFLLKSNMEYLNCGMHALVLPSVALMGVAD